MSTRVLSYALASPLLAGALLLGLLSPKAEAQSGALDVSLQGGAFSEVTTIHMEGPPGRKHFLLLSVFNVPNMAFLPNINTDIGIEFLNICFVLPNFVGLFNGGGTHDAALFVTHMPELDIFPLYFQNFMTAEGTNKLDDKSTVQKWTLQAKNSWKPPHLGFEMAVERSTHTMTLLPDRRVLIVGGGAGGITTSYGSSSVELYDTRDEGLTAQPSLLQPRTGHSATLLNDGRVLVVGGADEVLGEPTNTAEIRDPVTGVWTAVGNLVNGPRALHRATLLQDGRVLITGGTDNFISPTDIILGAQKTTEIFNPVTNTFSAGPNMTIHRLGETATALPDGNVLITGGFTKVLGFIPLITSNYETYNFSAGNPGSFSSTGTMGAPNGRFGHAAVALPDGSVLVVGGASGADPLDPAPEQTWERWTESTGFMGTNPLNDGRILPTVDLLTDGRVLIAGGARGGFTTPESVASCEVWSPITELSTVAASLLQDRAGHQSVRLPDGTVLVSGGGVGTGTTQAGLASLEIYQP
ncbi:MAG: Kelch repeat-containing protein [Planctomycetota bacterium]